MNIKGKRFTGKICDWDLEHGYSGNSFVYTGETREPKRGEWFVGCGEAMKNEPCPSGKLCGGEMEILCPV